MLKSVSMLPIAYFYFLCVQLKVVLCHNCSLDLRGNPFPQFQIIAAAKTGSTSLYSYLCDHTSIDCIAKKKELNFLRSNQIDLSNDKVGNRLSHILQVKTSFTET